MLDPIASMTMLHGEDAVLSTPANTKSQNYDPSAVTDFVPGAPVSAPVRGFIANIDMVRAELDAQATMGFTISTSTPLTIINGVTKLFWDGTEYTVSKARKRRFLGKLNGYTVSGVG